MNKFKIGDTVRRIRSAHAGMGYGDTAVVTNVSGINLTLKGYKSEHDAQNFELAEPQFDMKTSPWEIRVNTTEEFASTQRWLEANFGTGLPGLMPKLPFMLTNTTTTGDIMNRVMWGDISSKFSRREIKLQFETTIKSVTYPEVETEQQRKIRELQETIEKAQKQIADLQQGV
ncbi:hypothetical protein D3C85_851520 [compost metagenome]